MSYDMIDRFLRNNLGDDDYAEYSAALDSLCVPQRTWVGLEEKDMPTDSDPMYDHKYFTAGMVYAAIKLKKKNT